MFDTQCEWLEFTAAPSTDDLFKKPIDYSDADWGTRQLVPDSELEAMLALEVCR